ncbi:Ig-like domain-containing protein [Pseudomonas cichorii]|uniref:Ig-like domain-containing protein n=1 Tax=Pseudomonas cichorii TaxID=36746 RepID=UPI0018E631D2|nr:Ig-like domain-containing protein [Pseudomonas cichorii]MBI6855053.1 Ig-like domain-containing protein [Pseudomonas cichorii]
MTIYSEISIVEGLASSDIYWVGQPDPVKFSVWLQIDGNSAVGFPVDWSVDGESRAKVASNEEGVSSMSFDFEPGEHTVTATISGAVQGFEFRVFANPQSVQYVRFNSIVVAGIETMVVCALVEHDGSPVAGREVTWSDDIGGLLETTSRTDDNGIASARFRSNQDGNVVVTVSAEYPVKDKSSEPTIIHSTVVIDRSEASGTEFLVGSADPLVFSVWLKAGGLPAWHVSVDWLVNDFPVKTTYTDNEGMAGFGSTFERGDHVVKAIISGTTIAVEFPVSAMTPYKFQLTTEGDYDEENPDLLGRSYRRDIVVKVVDENDRVLDGVEFRMDYEQTMNCRIAGVGETQVSSVEGTRFKVDALRSSEYGDIEVFLSGRLLEPMKKTYKLGWICYMGYPGLNSAGTLCYVYLRIVALGLVGEMPPDFSALLDFAVEGKSWRETLLLTVDGYGGPQATISAPVTTGLEIGDWMTCSRAVFLDGCMAVVPSRGMVTISNSQ